MYFGVFDRDDLDNSFNKFLHFDWQAYLYKSDGIQ